MSICALKSSILFVWLATLNPPAVHSLITKSSIANFRQLNSHNGLLDVGNVLPRIYSVAVNSRSSNEEEMTAQERILRDAGLWEKVEEKEAEEEAASGKDGVNKKSSEDAAQQQKRRNVLVAVFSSVIAFFNFFWQYSHPITDVQLLASMQQNSAPVTCIGNNGKPTVVDFWAPWCENCKMAAPTLNKIEEEYRGKVNFVMINGDQSAAWPYIEAFGVDAIPHLALVSAEGDVETALIGPTPKSILEADLDVMIRNSGKDPESKVDIPYIMLDVFKNNPDRRRVHFDK